MLIPITTSAEVRWFGEGTIPGDLMIWFNRSKCMCEEAKHNYLYLPCNRATTVGFTLRERTLDVKSLQKSSGLHRFAENIKGHIQLWIRWSHEISGIDTDVRTLFENDRWVNVCEQRRLRKFSLNLGKLCEVRGNDAGSQPACHIELTQMELDAKKFWSFGFESFGHANQVEEILKTVSTYCFSERQSPVKRSLNGAQSLPYPEWIRSVHPGLSQPYSKRDECRVSIGSQVANNTRKQLNEMRSIFMEDPESFTHKYDRSLTKEELGEIIGRKL